jgi:hypothetical protein
VTILSIFLFLSVCLNILIIWYARKITNQFVYLADNITDLENTLTVFEQHLNGVYELEMFYGDDTLEALISHSKAVVNKMKDFNDSFSLDSGEEDEIDEIN